MCKQRSIKTTWQCNKIYCVIQLQSENPAFSVLHSIKNISLEVFVNVKAIRIRGRSTWRSDEDRCILLNRKLQVGSTDTKMYSNPKARKKPMSPNDRSV